MYNFCFLELDNLIGFYESGSDFKSYLLRLEDNFQHYLDHKNIFEKPFIHFSSCSISFPKRGIF